MSNESDMIRTLESHAKRSGGAGSLTSPLSDEDYRREIRKLERAGGEPQ